MEPIRHEGERDAGDPGGGVRSRQRPGKAKGAVSREEEAQQRRDSVDGERGRAQEEEREQEQRDAVVVLAPRERVLVREHQVPVEEAERVRERRVPVPPEDPGVQVRVARVRYPVADHRGPGPRHQDRECREGEENAALGDDSSPLESLHCLASLEWVALHALVVFHSRSTGIAVVGDRRPAVVIGVGS